MNEYQSGYDEVFVKVCEEYEKNRKAIMKMIADNIVLQYTPMFICGHLDFDGPIEPGKAYRVK